MIVTIHLILGMSLLALMCWLGARQDSVLVTAAARGGPSPLRPLALAAAVVLLIQIALGGWVSTNYATLACSDYPLCNGQVIPEMDFEHGYTLWRELGKTAAGHYLPFSALTAIHWVHRNFAYVVLLVVGLAAWRAMGHADLRRTGRWLAMVLAAQAITGIATVYLEFPLAIAVLHNAGAALLVVLVTMLNYKTKHSLGAPAPARPIQ